MEKYFDIRYEFDVPTIHKAIEGQIAQGTPDYICVADGNILSMVYHNEEYREIVNGGLFSICDSSWVPQFVRWLYGHKRTHYCGSDIFIDIVRSRKYRMIFLGTKQKVLNALQKNLQKYNPDIAQMTFKELPFCSVEQFNYKEIATIIEQDKADIVWVALGAPKQEIFMSHLKPHLNNGVIIAVGAAFNFYSKLPDTPRRCPQWMRKLHIEFIHRIITEPGKQLKRCWRIIITIPKILEKEYILKGNNRH